MMNPQRIFSTLQPRRLAILQTVLLISLAALCAVGMVSSMAQSQQKEREIEDKIPAHLPIKIKVKNAEKVRDLKNDEWLRDLEIEVKNTGDKPIYFLSISVYFIDVQRDGGEQIGYPLRYGRPQLIDFTEPLISDDVPINPGETYILTMPESAIKGWAWYKTKVEKKPHPKKVGIRFQGLNFGDGTGFHTSGGLPVPNRKSSTDIKRSRNMTVATKGWQTRPPELLLQLAPSFLPANFLPVNFFQGESYDSMLNTSLRQTCCPNTSCTRMRQVFRGNCFCPGIDAFSIRVDYSCSDLFAECGTQRTEFSDCGEGETYHTCTNFFVDPCGATIPTPTPEPTPTPDPDVCNGVARPNDDCTCAGTGASAFWQCNPMCDTPAKYPKYPNTRLA